MFRILRKFDWLTVLFALVACYLLPALVFGSLAAATSSKPELTGWALVPNILYALAVYLGAPIAAGYFTARFAANRPKLHVLVVATLGVFLACLSYRGPLLATAAYAVALLLLAALGAFLCLRGKHRNEA